MILNLLKAIRLPECFLVLILGYIGFKYAGIKPDALTLIARFFVMAVTMLQNDWVDRVHDIKKGKTFANDNPKLFLTWLILFWIICGVLIVLVFSHNSSAGYFLFGLALLGALYSEARRMPLLSLLLVSIPMIGSTVLLPLAFGGSFQAVLFLFIGTILIMFGRENFHDIADVSADLGYKKTIPIIMGDKVARISSVISLVIGCVLLVFISPMTLVGSAFIVWGLSYVTKDSLVVKVRKLVDVGLVLLVLGLISF